MQKASRMAHAAISVMSIKQTIAYSSIVTPVHEGAGAMALSEHGEFLWIYALLWGVSAAASIYGVLRGRGKWSILLCVFLCFCWAGGYATAWVMSEYASDDLMTACTYLSIAIAFMAIYRYLDLLRDKQAEHVTSTIQQIGGRN